MTPEKLLPAGYVAYNIVLSAGTSASTYTSSIGLELELRSGNRLILLLHTKGGGLVCCKKAETYRIAGRTTISKLVVDFMLMYI